MSVSDRHLDSTLVDNYLRSLQWLVDDYRLVKAGKHPKYKFVTDFYNANNIKRQNFIKIYNRYVSSGEDPSALLPQKRGRKFSGVMADKQVQDRVVELREQGMGRYDIFNMMLPDYGGLTPKPSTIYNILKANGLNRFIKDHPEVKQRYVKQEMGELVHIDCHYLPRGLIDDDDKRYFLIGAIDDHSRVAWCDVIEDVKSITVSYGSLKLLSVLKQTFDIETLEVMTDNGAEFGSGRAAKNKDTNPFKSLMNQLTIKQRFTRPGRPQTNGKIERFWQTIETELLSEQTYENKTALREELLNYLIYYNYIRPHQGIKGYTPYKQMTQTYKQKLSPK